MAWPTTALDPMAFSTCQEEGHDPVVDDDGMNVVGDADTIAIVGGVEYEMGLALCARCGLAYWLAVAT